MNYQESTDIRTETTRAIAESVSTSICDLGGECFKQFGWVENQGYLQNVPLHLSFLTSHTGRP